MEEYFIYRVRMKQRVDVGGEIGPISMWAYCEAVNPQRAIFYYLKGGELAGMTAEMSTQLLADSEELFDVERLEIAEKIQ